MLLDDSYCFVSRDTQEDIHTNAEVDEEGFTIRPQENERILLLLLMLNFS